nr:helix-turn-helix domain-containing protein [uncultured Oscillibacter sp.]
MVPNEVFHIGLSYPEISIYCYLLSIEDRETYQCYPSYKTIGKALGMCENTVSKYVRSLEEKGLIRTEPTMVRSKDGRTLNGNLLYTICPIQAAVELLRQAGGPVHLRRHQLPRAPRRRPGQPVRL